jgi:hypothetical protein
MTGKEIRERVIVMYGRGLITLAEKNEFIAMSYRKPISNISIGDKIRRSTPYESKYGLDSTFTGKVYILGGIDSEGYLDLSDDHINRKVIDDGAWYSVEDACV